MVTQSVELLLDEEADAAVRRQWDLLAEAGLPTERRSDPTRPGAEHHGPHITLYAGDAVAPETDRALSALLAGLDLGLQIGALTLFGPRRGTAVLVRQVTPSSALVRVQEAVAELCGADPEGQFAPGRWSPHVTLAHRVPVPQLGDVVTALDWTADRPVAARVTRCRRWDGEAKTAWLL